MLTALLLATLAAATYTDLRTRRIPNALTAAAAVGALTLDPSGLPYGLAAGASLLAAALARPGGLGMGDVKLAAVMGLCLHGAVAVAILAALLIGAVAGAAARAATLPFAPCLAVGGLVAALAP